MYQFSIKKLVDIEFLTFKEMESYMSGGKTVINSITNPSVKL